MFVICGVIILIVVFVVCFFLLKDKGSSAKQTFETFISAVKEKDYDNAYDTLANKSDWKQVDFTKRIKSIYSGIDMKNMKVEVQKEVEKKNITTLTYKASMKTIAGELVYENKIEVKKNEDGYYILCDSSQVLPSLKDDETVNVQVKEGNRGMILDRNSEELATQGVAYDVGFIAGLIDDKEKAIDEMATCLGMERTTVENKLNASWVQDGMFVPIKKLSADKKQGLSVQLNSIDGASIQQSATRVYPYGEMLAYVTGYVQSINADELKKYKDEEYDENSVIGKDGLEKIFEKDLKPTIGYQINILHFDGTVDTLVEKKAKDGKNITTTIDVQAQQVLYEQLKSDAGAGVMMDTHTGEVLAMVSSPSYNPNTFVLGMSNEEWDSLSKDPNTPLLDRTTSIYSPGSSFKAITGAIGIDTGTIQSDTTYDKTDKWQKENSWGDNYVTTTKLYPEPSNLLNAYINSDNIYFAQLADNIGKQIFSTYLDAVGFQTSLGFTLPVDNSSYGKLSNDQELSAAGYGQGKLLISPLHVTSLYTAYKNGGTIMKPYLIYKDGKNKYLRSKCIKRKQTLFLMI